MICRSRILVLAFIAIAVCMMSAGTVTAATVITVDAGGSIQNVIDANTTANGSTIEVHSGTYYENVLVNKQLTLRGIDTGSGMPVVDAGGNGNAIELSADGITLEGFTVKNATAQAAGIMVGDSSNNTITGNSASNNDNGIYIWLTSNNNTLRDNSMFSNGYNFVFETDSIFYPIDSSENILKNAPKSARSPNNGFYNTGATGGAGGGSNGSGGGAGGSLFDNDIDTSNLVEGKPIYYLLDASGTIINSSSNAGMVVCIRCDDIEINDLALANNSMGIYLYHSNNSSIQNNTVYNNIIGIELWDSSNITLSGNNVSKNIDGIWLSLSNNNNFTNNNVSNNDFGISLESSNNNDIMNNDASYNYYDDVGHGIGLYYSNNITLSSNNASSNDFGIYLESSNNNTIMNNDASYNYYDGIGLYFSNNTMLSSNNASSNDFGIYFWRSNNNDIMNNDVSYNNYSVVTDMSDQNVIYHNNFINNLQNAFDNSGNLWNASYPTGGNYWSSYTGPDIYSGPDQDVPGSDGIGDTSYSISGGTGANDSYPYMDENGWDADTTPPTVAITSHVWGQIVTTSSITIAGTASDDYGIATVSVNDIFATGTTNWNAGITLAEGTNTILVTATDTAGNTATEIISVIYAPVAANIIELKGKVATPTDIGDIFSYNTNIVWNASNFVGFYYDSDYGIGSESLTILHDVANFNGDTTNLSSLGNDNRTIFEDHLVYDTITEAKRFEYEGFGNYSIIGIIGEPYFAGYLDVSTQIENNTKKVTSGRSILENGVLSKVLIDSDDKYTIATGDGLELKEGYVLYVSQVDLNGEKALLKLRNNGVIVDEEVVYPGYNLEESSDVYAYDEANLGDKDNFSLIIARVSTVFRGADAAGITIEGLFQISDTLMEVSAGHEYGVMMVTDTTSNTIRMKNREYPIYLERDSAKTVMGDMMFKVADNDALSFYPLTILVDTILPVSIITEPEEHAYVKGNIDIIGTAEDPNFHNYTVDWKNTTVDWTWIIHSTTPVTDGILAALDTTDLADGAYVIRLNVTDEGSNSNSIIVNVTIDNTLPSASLAQPVEAAYVKGIVDITGAAIDANFLNYTVHRKNTTSGWMGMQNSTTPVSNGILATLHTTGLADGIYVIRLNVTDEASNTNSTIVNVTIDNTRPAVTDFSVLPQTPEINTSVHITAKVKDFNLNNSNPDIFVSVKYPDGFINSTRMTDADNDVYSLDFNNISEYGRYNVTIIASDLAGNINDTETISFVTVMPPYVNESIDTTANNTTPIDALGEANTTLDLVTSNDTTGETLSITMSNEIPPHLNQSFGVSALGKYISIDPSVNLNDNIAWAIIKIYYTDAELTASGLDENSLVLRYYNEPSGMWELIDPSGVNVNTVDIDNYSYSGYVWANVSHFSYYGAGGELEGEAGNGDSGNSGGNSGGGGGGGGGGGSNEPSANIEINQVEYLQNIVKDTTTDFSFADPKTPVTGVSFYTQMTPSRAVEVRVQQLYNHSVFAASDSPNIAYKYLNIISSLTAPKEISDIKIKFKVANGWIASNGIKTSDVVMYRWHDDKWNPLLTEKTGSDTAYVYYTSNSPGFSPFCISTVLRGDMTDVVSADVDEDTSQTSSPIKLRSDMVFKTNENVPENRVSKPLYFGLIILIGLLAGSAYLFWRKTL